MPTVVVPNDGQIPDGATPPGETPPGNAPKMVEHAVYAGMQKRYQALQTKHTAETGSLQEQVTTLGEKVSGLETQLTETSKGRDGLTKTVTDLQTAVKQRDDQLSILTQEKDRWDLASTEYPQLASAASLVPLGNEDTMREGFKALAGVVGDLSDRKAKELIIGTTPPAGGGRLEPGGYTDEQLQEKLIDAAGSPEFEKWSKIWVGRASAGKLRDS